MVRIDIGNSAGRFLVIDRPSGFTTEHVLLEVAHESKQSDSSIRRQQDVSVALSLAECEALENALRIQRREAERRRK